MSAGPSNLCPALSPVDVAILCSFRLVLSHAQQETDVSCVNGSVLTLNMRPCLASSPGSVWKAGGWSTENETVV